MRKLSRPLLALDWGTTSLRGAQIDSEGRVSDTRHFAQGILSVPPGQFGQVFERCFGDWMQADTLCLISGMAGSRQGWQEAPYCPCPAGFDELGRHLLWLQPSRIALVPGLSCQHDHGLALNPQDVMRGEEVQIFGALALSGRQNATVVLPGTHSKWARVENGQVLSFTTFMTGEVFAVMGQHSILARTLDKEAPWDDSAFAHGVELAQHSPSVLSSLFATRTLALFDRLPAAAHASFLSGLLIGEELRAMPGSTELLLVGNATLTGRYARAALLLGRSSQSLDEAATWAGHAALARTLNP
jgi:2-dehydro-3-deoxygalactonokinase